MKEFRISEEDFLQAQKLHLGWKVGGPTFALWGVVTAYLVFRAMDAQDVDGWVSCITLSILSALALFLLLPHFRRRNLRAIYAEQKNLHKPIKMTFDDDSVQWRSDSGNAKIAWHDFAKYKENNTMFLIYESRNMMRVVPKCVFEDEDELSRFTARIRQVGSQPARSTDAARRSDDRDDS